MHLNIDFQLYPIAIGADRYLSTYFYLLNSMFQTVFYLFNSYFLIKNDCHYKRRIIHHTLISIDYK